MWSNKKMLIVNKLKILLMQQICTTHKQAWIKLAAFNVIEKKSKIEPLECLVDVQSSGMKINHNHVGLFLAPTGALEEGILYVCPSVHAAHYLNHEF